MKPADSRERRVHLVTFTDRFSRIERAISYADNIAPNGENGNPFRIRNVDNLLRCLTKH